MEGRKEGILKECGEIQIQREIERGSRQTDRKQTKIKHHKD